MMKSLFKRFLQGVLLVIGSFFFSGCFTIEEEVTVKKDGSGSYRFTIDASEFKAFIDAIQSLSQQENGENEDEASEEQEDEKGEASFEQISNEMSAVKKLIGRINGISNVSEINDTSSLVFGYAFDFSNVAALNKALYVIHQDKYEVKLGGEVFRLKGNNFERLNTADVGEYFRKTLTELEEEEEDMGNMINFFFQI